VDNWAGKHKAVALVSWRGGEGFLSLGGKKTITTKQILFTWKFMKLCIVTPSFSGGGAEKVAVNLANQYASEGKHVTLLVFKGVGPNKSLVADNVVVFDLEISRSRYVLPRLRKALIKVRPTHVISVIRDSNILVGLASIGVKKFKLVFREASTMHGVLTASFAKRFLYKNLMRLTYRMADLVIANSKDTKSNLVHSGIGGSRKIIVIGNPVIPLDFEDKRNSYISHDWLTGKLKIILNVGRLNSIKNQALLINAMPKVLESHSDAKLLILGEGSEEQSLLNQIDMLDLRGSIRIIPFQLNPFPYYRASDLFVLTSRWEGFGNILVEALACGVPVISTDCPGGPRSILDDGKYGTLVPCGEVDTLADAIIEELNNPYRWDKFVLEGRGNEYTVQSVAAEYLTQIKEAGDRARANGV
jgi:glycosyltransferase involved in cell wall biosynthesis